MAWTLQGTIKKINSSQNFNFQSAVSYRKGTLTCLPDLRLKQLVSPLSFGRPGNYSPSFLKVEGGALLTGLMSLNITMALL